MKEVTSEQLDIIDNAGEEEESKAAESSQEKNAKKTGSRKKQKLESEADVMDALEKVRKEERAKLEALQAREREKTRIMVEKERAKLEAELEKEIRALEAQLAKERAKLDLGEAVPSISLREEIAGPAAKKKSRKAAAAKPAAKKPEEIVQTAIGPIELGDQVTVPAPGAVSGQGEIAASAPEFPEAATAVSEASEVAAAAAQDIVVAAPMVSDEGGIEAAQVSGIDEMPAALAETEGVSDEIALPTAGASFVDAPIAKGSEDVFSVPGAVAPVASAPKESVLESPVASSGRTEIASGIRASAEASAETLSQEERDARTVINSLEKLREKIYAQKQLERKLLEREATKTQEKDRLILEKINQFQEELQSAELEGPQAQVDSLLEESDRLRRRIAELEAIINKVKALKINNITVIDENTFEISNDFAAYATDKVGVNKLIREIENELERLTEEHQRTIAKLREAEEARDQFYAQIVKLESENNANQNEIQRLRSELENKERLYLSQINNLNLEIQKAEEKLNEERDSNSGVWMQIETLRYEKQKLMAENSGLKAEIEMLKDKLDKRLESSVHVAARLDLLEAEKSLLENKIIQLNKQLLHRERIKAEERAEEPYGDLLSEIKRLKEDVNQLKTRQFPFFQPDYYAYPQESEHNCPYVRFFNPMLIPNLSYQPQALNGDLVNEIRNLKKEFEAFKQEKSSVSVSAKETPVKEDAKDILEQYSRQIRAYKEELEKNKAELSLLAERKDQEIARLTRDFETKIQAKDNEKNMIKAEKEKRIQELQQKIQEKDALLEKINQEVQRLTEEDIFDPEFKRKIRVIRDMRRECEEKAAKEEQEHFRNMKMAKDKIDAKNMEIDVINDKIFQLEMHFRQTGDYSSSAKEEYEKNKSKLLLERQLQEEKLREFEEDMSRLQSKHEEFLKNNEAEMEKLNNQEAETIEFYLNKLRRSRAKQMEGYRNTESEKEELVDQLDKLKQEPEKEKTDEIEVDMPFSSPREESAVSELENEISELTRQYSEYYRQITELKAEQDKRVEAEKRLRMNDKNVYDYCSSKVNLDECLKAYQEKSRLLEDKENALNQTANRPEDKATQLKLKAEIQDLEVHRNDLRAKIDFYRKQISELEKADIVQKYKSLLAQMDKINSILREKRDKAQEIKALVQAKTRELEMLRG